MARTILTVVGARPQFIKAAAVSRAIARRGDLEEVVVHTGQHYDPEMSDVFFKDLEMRAPEHYLDIGGGSHGEMTGRMLAALEALIVERSPDVVLVYGDTNSTLAGALAAAKLHVPVAHVEAGLRSFNRKMPEEVNRVLTDHVSSWLFCPTTAAVRNLAREGVVEGVTHVGDVMYDATLFAQARSLDASSILEDLDLSDGGYALATVHRAENTDSAQALSRIVDWLEEACARAPVVLPLHPRTRKALERFGLAFRRVRTISPVGYMDMNRLLHGAAFVATDSGGLQKEAYFHRKPCVTLRDETEWVELVDAGWNRLWGEAESDRPRTEIADYGRGDAADRIAAALAAAP